MSYRRELIPVRGRVTNGQRAAICGLVLAGVAYGYACNIAGVRPEMLGDDYIGPDWKKRINPTMRWTSDQLAELEGYWRDRKMKTETIARLFGVTPHRIWRIAQENNFPFRRPPGPAPNPKSIMQRPKKEQAWYEKLRKSNFTREQAKREMGLL